MSTFVTTKSLSLALADEIATLAINTAKKNKFNPIAICVMDPNGHEIVTKRMDGCPPMVYPKISHAKANTCVSTKLSSRAYGDKYLNFKGPEVGPSSFVRLVSQMTSANGDLACFQGGILVRDSASGEIVGSIGASGAAGDEDEYCCLMGVHLCSAATELITEPSAHSCKTVKE